MKNKEFDCVDSVREIRDEIYQQNKEKDFTEFSRQISTEAHESDLYKYLINNGMKVVSPSVAPLP